jgi:hypothetical protein
MIRPVYLPFECVRTAGETWTFSQFGGFICLDTYPTIAVRFLVCTKELIA